MAIVEGCNGSTEECWVLKGTVVASTSVVPESAFVFEQSSASTAKATDTAVKVEVTPEIVSTVTEVMDEGLGEKVNAERPDIPPDKDGRLKADSSESDLSEEQNLLFQSELDNFRDMFLESSKKPSRTQLSRFGIYTRDSPPIKQQPYRVSFAEGVAIEAEISQYLDLKLIRPSNSPWACPLLMIRKPDGGQRFCVGYRKLNAATVKDCYPMPLIDDILDVLGDAQMFSTMGITSGY
ncbi:hypothetical protein PI124_g13930 [Phytophthora idaei]|nr:hypothetical protein PI125_g22225 [Phytophthora idaei]KAG3151214.1 hypothetical protein PI126_g11109 [Phytophthora idaei]KAG3241194.1 hypothetical protein PI124_g13930 [Phytophthora idaei]